MGSGLARTEAEPMNQELEMQAMDFAIHVAELVKYLREEGGSFPLCDRLLAAATGLGCDCRAWSREGSGRVLGRALLLTEEIDYVLEIALRAGYLNDKQSRPIREDCKSLRRQLETYDREIKE